MLTIKTIRFAIVITLIAAYLILAICAFREGRYRMGITSTLFAIVTFVIFI